MKNAESNNLGPKYTITQVGSGVAPKGKIIDEHFSYFEIKDKSLLGIFFELIQRNYFNNSFALLRHFVSLLFSLLTSFISLQNWLYFEKRILIALAWIIPPLLISSYFIFKIIFFFLNLKKNKENTLNFYKEVDQPRESYNLKPVMHIYLSNSLKSLRIKWAMFLTLIVISFLIAIPFLTDKNTVKVDRLFPLIFWKQPVSRQLFSGFAFTFLIILVIINVFRWLFARLKTYEIEHYLGNAVFRFILRRKKKRVIKILLLITILLLIGLAALIILTLKL